MIVTVWGKEKRMEEVRALCRKEHICIPFDELSEFDLSKLDAVILPLQSIQGEKGNYMDRRQIEYPLFFWECLREDCKIIAGKETAFLNQLSLSKAYYLKDEAFLNENARLTAQGALFYILDLADRSLDEYNVDIIGKGHCGTAIGKLLKLLGMHVRYVRHGEAKNEDECTYEQWKKIPGADFVIPCAPCSMLDKNMISLWPRTTCVIDISGAEKGLEELLIDQGIRYVRAANLPEIFTPRSSGQAIYAFARRILNE